MKICPVCSHENSDKATICEFCGTPLSQQEQGEFVQHLSVGTKLQGEAYTIRKVLGQGGFGITYLCSSRRGGKFAIKELFLHGYCIRQGNTVQTIKKDYQSDKNKFLEEGQLLSEFQHSSIVRVFTWFEENNSAYIVMEYVEGRTLLKLLEESGQPLPELEAVNYIVAISEALRIVHQANVLHRDIKPDNIMVTNDSRVVLIDFGAARDFIADKTQTHSEILTPGYAPLEQYGDRLKRGSYTDIYALGATLYHLLTGEPPAPATDRSSGVKLTPPCNHHNAKVSRKVSDAVMYAMEMQVGDRPQSVDDFILVLCGTKAPPKNNFQVNSSQSSAEYSGNYNEITLKETYVFLLKEKDHRIKSLEKMIFFSLNRPTLYAENYYNKGDTMSDKSSDFKFGNVGGDVIGVAGGNISGVAGKDMTGVAGGNISGIVTATIGQLTKSETPEVLKLADLLKQLQSAIESDSHLSEKDKAKALKQVQALAEAGQNSKEEDKKDLADTAITMLKGLITGLPGVAASAKACHELLPLMI